MQRSEESNVKINEKLQKCQENDVKINETLQKSEENNMKIKETVQKAEERNVELVQVNSTTTHLCYQAKQRQTTTKQRHRKQRSMKKWQKEF